MPGKIKIHDLDFAAFVQALDSCQGDVFLETEEGDVLNLRSKLCQMMGLATILNGATVSEATIRCTDPSDETRLFRFNLYGEMPQK